MGVDLVGVDLVGVDFVRGDLVGDLVTSVSMVKLINFSLVN